MVMFLSSRRCDVDQIGKNLQCEQHRLNNPKVVGNMEKVYRLCSGLAIFSYGLLLFLGIHPLLARVGSFFPMKKYFAKTNV